MAKKLRFSRIVNDIPLNYKFFLIFTAGVLIPIVVVNLLLTDRMAGLIKDREQQNLDISLERARKDISSYIEGGIAVSYALNTDKVLYEMLDRTYKGQTDFYAAFDEQLRNRVISYIPVNNQILRINLYTDNPTIVSGGNYHSIDAKVRNSDWYHLWRSSDDPVVVVAYQAAEENNIASTAPYFSVIQRLDYYDSYDTFEKIVKIDIDLNKFYDVIIREQDYLDLYLLNGRDQIIMSARSGYQRGGKEGYPLFALPGHASQEDVHATAIGTAKYVKGWQLIGIAQGTRVTQAMHEMRLFVVAIAAAVILISMIIIYVMLRSYNYRVKRLARHMQKVSNEKFDLITIEEGRDEIGGLIRNFNMMTARINSLINNVYKLEIQQKNLEMERVRAELNFLQSQMNPHFLFNTLNAILVVCAKNNYTDVTDVVKSLSKLLRRLLSWKEDIVSVEEELVFIDMYLKIEKFRFRDKFEYDFAIEEEARHYKIPKMSIQPLVENACKHGIQAVNGSGKIKISASVEDVRLRVTIADNGIGIEADKLRDIILSVRNESSMLGTSIGIRNVHRRLELYYADQAYFNIVSRPGEGTVVVFEIPVKLLERVDNAG